MRRNGWLGSLLLAWSALAGWQCHGGAAGEPCRVNADCNAGLFCDPASRSCAIPAGTDAAKPPKGDAAPGTDGGGPGTDSSGPGSDGNVPGTDGSPPGSDASGPGADAIPPGTDAAPPGFCGDGACDSLTESCADCGADCGTCAACPAITLIGGASGSDTGSTSGAPAGPGCDFGGAGGGSPEVLYQWTAPSDGIVTFSTCGAATWDTVLSAGPGPCGSATTLACNDDSCAFQSLIQFPVTAGTVYFIYVGGYGTASGAYTLSWSLITGMGTCADPFVLAVPVPGPTTTVVGVNTCAYGADLAPPVLGDCATGANGPDVVYRLDLGYDATVSLDLLDNDGSVAIDTVLYIQSSCGSSTLACSDDIGGEPRHSHLDSLLAAGTYYVVVDDETDPTFACGNVALTVTTP